MQLDPVTVFVMLVAATSTSMLLMLWGWLQNRREQSLLWIAGGYACAAAGAILVAGRETIPDFASIDLANALAVYGGALTYSGLRSFNDRSTRPWLGVVAAGAWLAACQIPAIDESYAWRTAFSGALTLLLLALCVVEGLRTRDGLKSRLPLAGLFGIHCIAVAVRTAIAVNNSDGDLAAAFQHPAFGPLAIEAAVFAQAVALTMLALTKERIERGLRAVARTDALTGLPNRRAFFEAAEAVLAQGARHRRPTSLAILDLDRFKQINDTFGHPAGDAVLRVFASALRDAVRASDVAGRLGGEEFAVILPDTDASQALRAVERIMQAVAGAAARDAASTGGFTTSAGVASSRGSTAMLEALFVQADAALYEAKRLGGNRVRASVPDPVPARQFNDEPSEAPPGSPADGAAWTARSSSSTRREN